MRATKRKIREKLLAILYAVLTVLLIWGPQSIFAVCEAEEKQMKCYWSTRAVLVIAVILLVIAVLLFAAKSIETKIALSLLTIASAVMVILIPAKVIGGCSMKTMACQSLTFPAFYVIGVVLIASAAAEIVILTRERGEAVRQERDDEYR